jgi:hypothetical protein
VGTPIGLLVHGDNHFIVEGPPPDEAVVRELVRHWSLIQIGGRTPAALQRWSIRRKAFREELEWAVVVGAETAIQPAVEQLLAELAGRVVEIRRV